MATGGSLYTADAMEIVRWLLALRSGVSTPPAWLENEKERRHAWLTLPYLVCLATNLLAHRPIVEH